MAQTDHRGLPLSTESAAAAAQYRQGVDLLLSAWPGPGAAFDAAIGADPDFALAHAARARVHALRGEGAAARAAIATAGDLVAHRGTAREKRHVALLASAIEARAAETLQGALAHVEEWPRDAVIFALMLGAFGLLAFSGRADHDQARMDLCERHARHFAEDDWWFLNYRGWSLTEAGARATGRALTQRSHELRRENANAVHGLSHAMFEDGAGREAEALIVGWLPGYHRSGTLHGHLAWHAALAALERGDTAGALALHAAHVHPGVSQGLALNVVTDNVSFLWRLGAYGHPVPAGLWEATAAFSAPLYTQAGFPFADIHMAMLDAATGRPAAVEARAAALDALIAAGKLPAGPVVPAVCRAARAFAAGENAACIQLLEPLAAEAARIGGSGAQREIIEDMLLIALLRRGEAAKARALLDRRLHRRPSPRDAGWRTALPG
jgi:hypothetical protein